MGKHTPLPWVQRGNKLYIDGPSGQSIADLKFQNGAADLGFILQACNVHNDLLAAVKELLQWAVDDSGACVPQGTFEIVTSAISKAEGR